MGQLLDKIRVLLIALCGLLCGLLPGVYTTVCDAADCGQAAVAAVCCGGEHAHGSQDWQRGHHHHTVIREELQRAPLNTTPQPMRAERVVPCGLPMLHLLCRASAPLTGRDLPPEDAPPGFRMPLLI